MSDRERWIVYPLLFLALGSALRDKLFKETRAKQIRCEQLVIIDQEGRPQAVLNSSRLDFKAFGNTQNGLIEANTINSDGVFQLGQRVVTLRELNTQGMKIGQVLGQFFQQVQAALQNQQIRRIPNQGPRSRPPAQQQKPPKQPAKPSDQPSRPDNASPGATGEPAPAS